MAYDWGNAFRTLFGGGNIDTRTPQATAMDQAAIAQRRALEQEYQAAQSNPNYMTMSPAQQAYAENQLANAVRNRTSAEGSGGSGYENDQVSRALVDFRIGQIAQRNQNLNNLRQAMIGANQRASTPQTYQTGLLQRGGQALGGMAVGALGRGLGLTDYDDDRRNAGNPEGGKRVNPPGQPGGQSGGPGNTNPYSVNG